MKLNDKNRNMIAEGLQKNKVSNADTGKLVGLIENIIGGDEEIGGIVDTINEEYFPASEEETQSPAPPSKA